MTRRRQAIELIVPIESSAGKCPIPMNIYKKLVELTDEKTPCALGLIVSAQGSTPQKIGCKALIDESGNQWGTLGGGLVEAEGLNRMRAALESGTSEVFEIRLDESYSRDAGPICGGVMRIFAQPSPTANREAYRQALLALGRREPGALLTHLHEGGRAQWADLKETNEDFPTATEIKAVIDSNEPACLRDDRGHEVFVEPVIAPPRLLIVGGGHVGQAVAVQAVGLGFDVTVIDDRPEFVRPELFPDGLHLRSGPLRTLVAEFPQDDETYIVLVSKGHRPDAEALEGCIHGNAAYIGMIGSRRKLRFLRKHFIEEGLATEAEFDRIVAPIGYDIGAVTVPEIAVSIAAQLIAAKRNGRVDARSSARHKSEANSSPREPVG